MVETYQIEVGNQEGGEPIFTFNASDAKAIQDVLASFGIPSRLRNENRQISNVREV